MSTTQAIYYHISSTCTCSQFSSSYSYCCYYCCSSFWTFFQYKWSFIVLILWLSCSLLVLTTLGTLFIWQQLLQSTRMQKALTQKQIVCMILYKHCSFSSRLLTVACMKTLLLTITGPYTVSAKITWLVQLFGPLSTLLFFVHCSCNNRVMAHTILSSLPVLLYP